jgi:DNA invertase Pin-like site-specific DNA recombinase
MARKSRKNLNINADTTVAVKQKDKANVLPTAAYIRLSVENNGHETDDSLKTQISLVESYISEQDDLALIDTYVDNGVSGTRFDRPEFVRMMEDVRCGRIRCIVVKDLSRFGRDYLETGYYIETIFPLLNVRFIAITDRFDNTRESDRDSLSLPIKNLVNDMYAKDFSRKQEAFWDMCRKKGRVMGHNNAYGYKYSEETGRLEIDKETEPYVRMIFAWTLSGVERKEIARRMELIGAPTPGESANAYKKANWSGHLLKPILYNPIYAGFHVMGRRRVCLYKGIKQHEVDRDQWLYFPNYHEPYITMDEYEEIQKIIKKYKDYNDKVLEAAKENRANIPDYFPEKVMCADCNRKMMFLRSTHERSREKLSFGYYRCRTSKSKGVCRNGHVQGNFLQIVVTDQIRELIRVVCDRDLLLKKLEAKLADRGEMDSLERKISRLQEEAQRYAKKLLKAYTDYADKLLDEEEYVAIKKRLTKKKEETEIHIKELERTKREQDSAIANFHQMAKHLEEYLDMKEFSPKLADELVERIWIHENGAKIEIEFKCQDVFQNPLVNEFLEGETGIENSDVYENFGS